MTTTNSEKPYLRLAGRPNLSKKDENQLIDFANNTFHKMKTDRWRQERQWYMNLAFYFGKQNVVAQTVRSNNSSQFKLYTPVAPYWRSRPVINRIRPLIRTEMSKLVSNKPTAYIVPSSSDDRDLYAAQCGEQIWESIYRDKNINKAMRRAVFWSSLTGNGFLKSFWDPDKPDYFSNLLGDMCFEPITPFHIFVPDLRECDIEYQPFVLHATNKSLESLELQSRIKAQQAKSEQGNILEESFLSVMDISENAQSKDKNTLILEYWVKPGQLKLFPDGGMFSVAGSTILDVYPGWPYEHKQYPFSHIRHIETGKFYADSVIDDLIPLQREFNRTRGQIIEAKNRMAKPQLAYEIGALDPDKVTSEPGQMIGYRPGFNPPVPIPLQDLPSYVSTELDRIAMDMNEISGQHEVSRGQVPPGVTAATAISYLQEQDDTKLAYTYTSIEEAYEKIGYQALNYVKQYWTTERKIKVTGPDGSFDVMAFEGSDLRDNTDIRVESGSALPTSRAAKQAFIMDLMKLGFIDPNKGLEVMEIGGINKIYEQVQVDVRQAQRENLRMAGVTPELLAQHNNEEMQKFMSSPETQSLLEQGMIMEGPDGQLIDISQLGTTGQVTPIDFPLIVPVNTWDEHRIHIDSHNRYRKSQAFETLSPEAKQLFEDHVNEHVSAIMVGAQAAMGIPPEALQMGASPETYKEANFNAEQPQQENLE